MYNGKNVDKMAMKYLYGIDGGKKSIDPISESSQKLDGFVLGSGQILPFRFTINSQVVHASLMHLKLRLATLKILSCNVENIVNTFLYSLIYSSVLQNVIVFIHMHPCFLEPLKIIHNHTKSSIPSNVFWGMEQTKTATLILKKKYEKLDRIKASYEEKQYKLTAGIRSGRRHTPCIVWEPDETPPAPPPAPRAASGRSGCAVRKINKRRIARSEGQDWPLVGDSLNTEGIHWQSFTGVQCVSRKLVTHTEQ